MTEVTKSEMLEAYRRAKADMHQQRGLPILHRFVVFEQALDQNLESVRGVLNTPAKTLPPGHGQFYSLPRARPNVGRQPRSQHERPNNIDPSDPETIDRLVDDTPRRLFVSSIPLLLLSSVWIDRVGVNLEQLQLPSSRGNRLRLNKKRQLRKPGPSFAPYIGNYIKWRDEALMAAARASEENQAVEILTFDIKNFYGKIDVGFLMSSEFSAEAGFSIDSIDPLRLTQRLQAIIANLDLGNDRAGGRGLPIGLPASAVIANAALWAIDKRLHKEPGLISYGRYVDDFIIVRRLGVPGGPTRDETVLFNDAQPSYLKKYGLEIATEKTRSLKLNSEYSKVLLNELRASFQHLSSEWRQLPTQQSLIRLANLVTQTGAGRRIQPELREADTIAIERLALSSLLSKFAKYASFLPQSEWATEWKTLYDRFAPVVLAAANLPATLKYLTEFLAITILSGDLDAAHDAGRRLLLCRTALERKNPGVYRDLDAFLDLIVDDATIVAAASFLPGAKSKQSLSNALASLVSGRSGSHVVMDEDLVGKTATRAFLGDYGLRPTWEMVLTAIISESRGPPAWVAGFVPLLPSTKMDVKLANLLHRAMGKPEEKPSPEIRALSTWLSMASRVSSVSMLTLLLDDDYGKWAQVVEHLTGTVPPKPPSQKYRSTRFATHFDHWDTARLGKLTVAVGNIDTTEDWWLGPHRGRRSQVRSGGTG